MNIRRKINLLILALVAAVATLIFLYNQVYLSAGVLTGKKTILIEKGDNALEAGEKFAKADLITGKYYLAYYLWRNGQLHSLVAGVYEIPRGLKVPEVAKIITGGQVAPTSVPVTFPEGWTMKKMSERLSANGFSGDDFLAISQKPTDELKSKYKFLGEIPAGKSLEGYLFPDTYYFAKDASAEDIVGKMLANFNSKITDNMQGEILRQKKSLYDIVTMASIIEGEVANDADRKIVAGLFWNRIDAGMALGSDATLEYVFGDNKKQHSIAETKIDSPYNTYRYKGLPPGPVSNPGILAIEASIFPAQTNFNYFLTDPKTGKTIFSTTFAEHVANKTKYGL